MVLLVIYISVFHENVTVFQIIEVFYNNRSYILHKIKLPRPYTN